MPCALRLSPDEHLPIEWRRSKTPLGSAPALEQADPGKKKLNCLFFPLIGISLIRILSDWIDCLNVMSLPKIVDHTIDFICELLSMGRVLPRVLF
jgi:hypothetical protein